MTGGLPHIKSGKVRALAVSSPARMAGLPDVPTISDPASGFVADGLTGILAPAGTPKEAITTLNSYRSSAFPAHW